MEFITGAITAAANVSINGFQSDLVGGLVGLGGLLTLILGVLCVIGMLHGVEESGGKGGIMGIVIHWVIIFVVGGIVINVLLAIIGITS